MRLTFAPLVHIGRGCIEEIGTEAALLGRRALLVTGQGSVRQTGTLDRALARLKEAKVEAAVFEGVPPEPDLASVDAARNEQRNFGARLVIGIGGGSALDVAKATGALAAGDAPTGKYFHGDKIPEGALPILAVPTTSGTGTEATPNSVLTDPQVPLKKSIRGPGFVPSVVIVDGDLTVSCPPQVTACSGMDALTQAIESLLSKHARPTTEALSEKAIALIGGSLLRAFEDGEDADARMAMSEGSFLAGVALCNARLGAVHGLAHPIGALTHLPHGQVCATLLPVVLEMNMPAIAGKLPMLQHHLGQDPIARVRQFMDKMNVPHHFDFVPDQAQMRMIVEAAKSSGSSKANPVPVDEGYVREVLAKTCVRAGGS